MKYCVILLILMSCFRPNEETVLLHLEQKLEVAKSEKNRAKEDIKKLIQEIDETKIALIRHQINDYEKKKEKPSTLFAEEREVLYQLIQSGRADAQVELDRILSIITELSDEENYVF